MKEDEERKAQGILGGFTIEDKPIKLSTGIGKKNPNGTPLKKICFSKDRYEINS